MSAPAPPRERRPTLADVARLAGVSLGSASRVLSVPEQVKPATREKVERAVVQLGYIRDGAARALASRRTHTIAALYPTLNNPIFAHSTHSMQQTLWRLGYQLLITSPEYQTSDEPAIIRATLERGVDGLIMVGTDHSDDIYALLRQRGLPYVLIWSTDETDYPHCVGISNFQSMYDLTRVVLEYGHRDIAVCGGHTARNERARGRRDGVLAAMAEQGLAMPAEWILETPLSYQAGRDAFRQLWSGKRRPTAILFGTDLQAIGALYEARRMGVRVPQDVSILGFDNIEEGEFMQPALSTIRLPAHEIGRLAAERVVALIEGRDMPPARPLAHSVLLRESLGPVNAKAPPA